MLFEENLFNESLESRPAAIPAVNEEINIFSHGDRIFGRVLVPNAKNENDRFPAVVFLHGYPGTEANLDIVHAFRRAGVCAVHFYYRGVWGSHGYYKFSHLYEDAECVLDHLRENADQLKIDPDRIYIIGYSMGGFCAMNLLARGAKVKGAVLLSPCDIGDRYLNHYERYIPTIEAQKGGYFRTPDEDYMDQDVREHAEGWQFPVLAEQIDPKLPIRFVGGEFDDVTPPPIHTFPAMEVMKARGMDVTYEELPDGHEYAGHRILLTKTLFRKIIELERL